MRYVWAVDAPPTTDWRAVGNGFLGSIVTGVVAFLRPGIGHIGAGLIGGGVTGYLADSAAAAPGAACLWAADATH